MNWDTLISLTAKRSGQTVKLASDVLDSFLDELVEAMKTEARICLRSDFGSFAVKDSGGREIHCGESITKSYRVPLFKRSNKLRKQLRQSDEEYAVMQENLRNGKG